MANSMVKVVKWEDFSDLVKTVTQDTIIAALDACGIQAVAHASAYAQEKNVVETGRLKASITHTVSGRGAWSHSYTDDNKKLYTESIPAAGEKKENTLYVGSNVEYFVYNELGTSRGLIARPMLRPALENHVNEYKEIIREVFSKLK